MILLGLLAGLASRVALIEGLSQHYTDIDYHVFTRAAGHLAKSGDPYQHSTYRYPPVLAWLASPNLWLHPNALKWLFVLGDLANYWSIASITGSHLLAAAYFLNPLAIYLTTRGSFDSLPLLLVIWVVGFYQGRRYFLAGLALGTAIHLRVYPVIFIPTLVFALQAKTGSLLSREVLRGAAGTLLALAATTLPSAWAWPQYLPQAVFYHLTRSDHRHSYSPLFLVTYLRSEGGGAAYDGLVGSVLQAVVVLSSGFRLRKDLPLAVLAQSWLFVLFNKVYTMQYMMWLNVGLLAMPDNLLFVEGRRRAVFVYGMILLLGVLVWWYFAIRLEGKGEEVLLGMWISSLGLFASQAYLLHRIVEQQLSPFEKGQRRIKGKKND
jgi:phosphatidylinositol glycan class M